MRPWSATNTMHMPHSACASKSWRSFGDGAKQTISFSSSPKQHKYGRAEATAPPVIGAIGRGRDCKCYVAVANRSALAWT